MVKNFLTIKKKNTMSTAQQVQETILVKIGELCSYCRRELKWEKPWKNRQIKSLLGVPDKIETDGTKVNIYFNLPCGKSPSFRWG